MTQLKLKLKCECVKDEREMQEEAGELHELTK